MSLLRTSLSFRCLVLGTTLLGVVGCQKALKAYPEELAGVGVVLQTTASGPAISKLVTGGPAATAGLQVGDHIVAVDGDSAESKSLASVVDALRGKDGSPVIVRVQSPRGDTTVTLTRKHMAKTGGDYSMN